MPANAELQSRLGSIEELLHRIESAADPSLRTAVQELMELVMNLHGAGLERMLELLRATGDAGEEAIQKLGRDELAGGLLVLHGLHPRSVEARVTDALDQVRARLRPHGAEVELLGVSDSAVRLRLHAKNQGRGWTAQSLKEMVEDAVYHAAPDLTSLTIEGAEETQSFVPLASLLDNRRLDKQPPALARNGLSLSPAGKGGL